MNRDFQKNLSVVLLNHNRFSLLRTTLLSLLETVPDCPDIRVVDNHSSDFSVPWLERMAKIYPQITLDLNSENLGGESLNASLEAASGEWILIAENDHQYLPGWDDYFARLLEAFPELGQISPLAAVPEREFGEVWSEKPFERIERNGVELHRAVHTVTTVGLIRREVLEKGIRFHNLEDREMPLPADERFSREIQEAGWWVGWSNPYQVINWGHHPASQSELPEYYARNWERKVDLGIDGLERLKVIREECSSAEERCTRLEQAYAQLIQLHHGTTQHELEEKIRHTEDHNRQLEAANQSLTTELEEKIRKRPSKPKPWYQFW